MYLDETRQDVDILLYVCMKYQSMQDWETERFRS